MCPNLDTDCNCYGKTGTIVKVGDEATNVRVGQRVAIEHGVPCRTYAQFIVLRLVVGTAGMLVVQPALVLIADLSYAVHRAPRTLNLAFWTTH